MNNTSMGVPLDNRWFTQKKEFYLQRADFLEFQQISGVPLENLASNKMEIKEKVQKTLSQQSIILNEIRGSHFGFGFPFFVYTQQSKFYQKLNKLNIEIDKIILGLDMTDSLRRRHIALSYCMLPDAINRIYARTNKKIVIKNLGSGVGLDTIRAALNTKGKIEKILNYDTNINSLQLGERIVKYLEEKHYLKRGVVNFINKTMTDSHEPADIIIMVGVICGLNNRSSKILLQKAKKSLNEYGALIVSAANNYMESTDPLASFLIQNIGSNNKSPLDGWLLNFRTKGKMNELLHSAGFSKIMLFDDANFPGKDKLTINVLNNIDCLPSIATGICNTSYKPLNLPPTNILKRNIGYNWLAIAEMEN